MNLALIIIIVVAIVLAIVGGMGESHSVVSLPAGSSSS